jgi:aspartyl-tRNA(Asn)/glutamyl-tRNA(Gln) amidotransferase subunit A
LNSYHSILAISDAIKSGKTNCVQLVNGYLQAIQTQKHLNAFLEVYETEALATAQIVDQKIANGTAGKLAGMVIGIKDVLCYKGHKVSASSKILEGFTSIYTATAVQRLIDEDAIIIGRLNCDEFAMGSSNENSAYGKVLNPLNNKTVPGGSSGGSAVAVAANLCLATLGTDTGGSVRQPASFCGIVGMKPTYGRISRSGVIAYASSFDQIGVFTHSVSDAALLLAVMSGQDELDSTTSTQPVPEFEKDLNLKNIADVKVAYLPSFLESSGLDAEIKNNFDYNLMWLKQQGVQVHEANFDKLDYLIPAYYILTTAEASSNLARYDGVHYGYRSPNAVDLESVYRKTRSEGFGPEVKRRIMLGTFVLSEGFIDAYYTQAQRVRQMVKQEVENIFSQYDFIITPTTPTTAFEFDFKKDPIAMYLNDIYTVLANIAGIPGISIPIAKHSNSLPFGLQIMSKRFDEQKLLAFANWMMQASTIKNN